MSLFHKRFQPPGISSHGPETRIANTFILNPRYTGRNDQGDRKLDYNFSTRDSVTFRFSRASVLSNAPDDVQLALHFMR